MKFTWDVLIFYLFTQTKKVFQAYSLRMLIVVENGTFEFNEVEVKIKKKKQVV